MSDKTTDNNKEIELMSNRAMIYLPENCVHLTLIGKVITDSGDVVEVKQILTNSDIHDAFKDAEENYIGPDDKFALTEEGRRYVEEIIKRNEI